MPKHLVIVESPTKAKTIKRFLGKDFSVHASMGHVRDLPSKSIAVDIDGGFEAVYEVPSDKKTVIRKLQEEMDGSDDLWIATDEDREGEAIGWHLTEVLKRPNNQPIKRIVFHEITQSAIEEAVSHPRSIDNRLVEAQQARRILDRLVGYTLSPFLWKKVYRGLSAGRVQSVAVRIIVDREREVRAFVPVEYWTVDAELENEAKQAFIASLTKRDGKKFVPGNQEEANTAVTELKQASFTVASVEEKELKKTPPPPFTTSTLQQEAGRKLGFSVKQTMVVAQQLYEGVDLGKGEGQVGLITYMRTDSVSLSGKALNDCKSTIEKLFGREYILSEPRRYKTKSKSAQEAHEAIRPTEAARRPASLTGVLDHQQLKLYTLVWNRTMATQMAAVQIKRVGVDIGAGKYTLRATGQAVLFDGYLRVYSEGRDESESESTSQPFDNDQDRRINEAMESVLPPLTPGQSLNCEEVVPEQHFTKPPPRYTEASLVKKLEEEGVGRPSTYAPTISTIQQRGYIVREGKQLVPQDIAFTVTDLLHDHFSDIVDLRFTADMEEDLDEIAAGKLERVGFLRNFYEPFLKLVEKKGEEISKTDVLQERELGKDPRTGLTVLVRSGRFGPYVQLGRLEEVAPEAVEKKKKIKKEDKPKSASIPKDLSKDEITLEQALELFALPRVVGEIDGQPVEVNTGRYGPYARCGETTTSLPEGVDLFTIGLAEVQELIAQAGERKKKAQTPLKVFGNDPNTGGEVQLRDGRYGPYVTDGKTNASLGRKIDPSEVTFELALELLEKKRVRGPRKGKWGGKKT